MARRAASTDSTNTERELTVSVSCPELYRPLAAELSRSLDRAGKPPATIRTSRPGQTALIETTSELPVAIRVDLAAQWTPSDRDSSTPVALLLPRVPNLVAWFRAFLHDVHESDPECVPHAPPRLLHPWEWYTPQERNLAGHISMIASEVERLSDQQEQLEVELADETESADAGIRRILWADGDNLVAAATEVLEGLGFKVHDMDARLREDEPKREDLRLTLPDHPGWEAIVEVKGYTKGTRTSDTRQIREHRDLYIEDEGRPPDLTMWLANPFRTMDPSSRPAPDQNVEEAAANVGAIHVQATDLYRQWALVAAGRLGAETVVQSLVSAASGLWTP